MADHFGSSKSTLFRPSKASDWEPYQATIADLYLDQNKKLKEVIEEMETVYYFKATQVPP